MTRIPAAVMAIFVAYTAAAETTEKGRKAAKPPAAYSEPYDFQGIRLGITLSEFKATPPPVRPLSEDYKVILNCSDAQGGTVDCAWRQRSIQYDLLTYGSKAHIDVAGQHSKDHSFEFIAKPEDPEPRLFRITLKMESSDMRYMNHRYQVLVDALEQRFGRPSEKSEVVQNAFGARFNNEIRSWGNTKSNVFVFRFADDLNTTELRYILIDHYRHYEKRLAEKRAKSPPKL
jgi:hypothetical protein